MRVADYLTSKLYDAGGEHVFMVTGGMIMHLTDALFQHGKQKFTCCHHEQAAVMAADGYGRFTGKLGVAYVTAGPGALNTLTAYFVTCSNIGSVLNPCNANCLGPVTLACDTLD